MTEITDSGSQVLGSHKMSNRGFLRLIVTTSLVTMMLLGGFNLFVLTPAFNHLIIENTESAAIKIARHLEQMLIENATLEGQSSPDTARQVALAVNDFSLMKLKVFTADGKTTYSTVAADIGMMNDHAYFRDIVARGGVYTKMVSKNTRSLENQLVDVDVVETYVPIMKEGKFKGAFEIYLDITGARQRLHSLLIQVHSTMALLSLVLLSTIFFITRKAERSLLEQEKTEAEKKNLIAELRQALEEVKSLRGIIPICSYCKQIRDDQGQWKKLEAYIHEHSDAEFSHGICPECLARQIEMIDEEAP